jgi:hypothetical protein
MPFYKVVCPRCHNGNNGYEIFYHTWAEFKKDLDEGMECPACDTKMKQEITGAQRTPSLWAKKCRGYIKE